MKHRRRHVPSRAELIARLPRGLRPRLASHQQLDLSVVHIVNLDLIANGQADEQVLWQWAGGVLTWLRVAQTIGLHADAMARQAELAARLIERYGRTGRVGFSGLDYQLAKEGTVVMDELALAVDQPTASAAADWSEALIQQLAADCAAAPPWLLEQAGQLVVG